VRESRSLRQSLALTYALGAALLATGVGVGLSLKYYGPEERPAIYSQGCLLGFETIQSPPCVYGAPNGSRTVVLFGDSHAGNWSEGLSAAALKEGWRVLVRVKAACAPVEREHRAPGNPGDRTDRLYTECPAWQQEVINELAAHPPNLIIASGSTFGIEEGERVMLDRLASISPTVAVRDTPIFPIKAPQCLIDTPAAGCSWPLSQLRKQAFPVAPPPNVTVLDFTDRVCPGGLCSAIQDRKAIMFDDQHLTANYSRSFADDFSALLQRSPKGWPVAAR
jgi:SGNH domain-containing protein